MTAQLPDAQRRRRSAALAAGVASTTGDAPATPPRTRGLDWSLILGQRPADEVMRTLDDLAALRRVGAVDLPRAALLAMLGHFDEAWPLAEARSNHLREISGNSVQEGHLYLG